VLSQSGKERAYELQREVLDHGNALDGTVHEHVWAGRYSHRIWRGDASGKVIFA
jgi:hypothetical protein